MWDGQLAAFAGRFRCAAWDARGYGDSDDYEGSLDFSDFSEDIVRVLDFLNVEKVHLAGLSMGGRIARDFALRHPQHVASLVLANTSPGFDALSPEKITEFINQRKNLDPASLAERLLGRNARPSARDALVASFAALRKDSYLKTLETSVAQDRAAPLEQLRVPTLVLTSDEDRLYPPAMAQAMARRIPRAEFVQIEGAGHLSNLEQPERFNAAVLEFLLRHIMAA